MTLRIQVATFDPPKLRLKLLKEFVKAFKLKIDEDELIKASEKFKSFQQICSKLYKESKLYISYKQSWMASGSCCGVNELTFEDLYDDDRDLSKYERVLVCLVLANGFVDYNKPTNFMKYYDNDQLHQGRKYLEALKKLGWKCTAKFINVHHDWLNFEMSAHYGDKLEA